MDVDGEDKYAIVTLVDEADPIRRVYPLYANHRIAELCKDAATKKRVIECAKSFALEELWNQSGIPVLSAVVDINSEGKKDITVLRAIESHQDEDERVKFDSRYAGLNLGVETMDFKPIAQDTSPDKPSDMVQTNRVSVSNLPMKPFTEAYLVEFLTAELSDLETEPGQLSIYSLDRPNGTCVVELDSVERAIKFAALTLPQFRGNELFLSIQWEAMEDTQYVKIHNLPQKTFTESYLVEFLTAEFVDKTNINKTSSITLTNLDRAAGTCVVELDSIESATLFASLTLSKFRGNQLILSIVRERAPALANTNGVRVENLPQKEFTEAFLLEFLNTELSDLGEGNGAALNIQNLDRPRGFCVIKLDSVDTAIRLAGLTLSPFRGNVLQLSVVQERATPPVKALPKKQAPTNLKRSVAGEDSGSEDEDVSENPVSVCDSCNSDQDCHVVEELSDPKPTAVLLESFIASRGKCTSKFRLTPAILSSACEDLKTYGLKVFETDCRKRWKTLGDTYRRERINPDSSIWTHRFDMAILKGEPNLFPKKKKSVTYQSAVRGLPPKKMPKVSSKGAFFDDAATICLINLRIEMDHKFDSSQFRNNALWDEISECMKRKNYMFNGDECKTKMLNLMDLYKEAKENSTGNVVKELDYFDLMDSFMGNWVNVQPECQFSFGIMPPD